MSPKGPLAPALSASEIKKQRRWVLWVLGVMLLALIPVGWLVFNIYPVPSSSLESPPSLPPPPPPLFPPPPSLASVSPVEDSVPQPAPKPPSPPLPEQDSLIIRGFRAPLNHPGVAVRVDLYLFSPHKGLSARYRTHAKALEVAVQNIFYITQPENLKIPKLEALILQKVGFVFPRGGVTRVEIRNLQTEWNNR